MPHPCLFDKLPLELLQEIGYHIEDDADLESYATISETVYNAIEKDSGSFWRRRFTKYFDYTTWPAAENREQQNRKYRQHYEARQILLASEDVRFGNGESPSEKKGLLLLVDMLVQSFSAAKGGSTTVSKHLERTVQWAEETNLHTPWGNRPRMCKKWSGLSPGEIVDPTKLLLMVHCLLAASVLRCEPVGIKGVYGLPDSQAAVFGTSTSHPLFQGFGYLEVNLQLVAHHLNYWKYWFNCDFSQLVYDSFSQLHADDKPRYWSSKLETTPTSLGRRWKGTYAYLNEGTLANLRMTGAREYYEDEFPGDEDGQPFQDLELKLVSEEDHFWPDGFEQHLNSLDRPEPEPRTRAQRKALQAGENFQPVSFRFDGAGSDQDENFSACGWLHALPKQRGVPGWQRMTMMKYYKEPVTGRIDESSLWAYEGVVLPGGQIVVGRWWRADLQADDPYSGPFILWCVD